jgi:Fe-S cluster assembly iron-binding protein IscA
MCRAAVLTALLGALAGCEESSEEAAPLPGRVTLTVRPENLLPQAEALAPQAKEPPDQPEAQESTPPAVSLTPRALGRIKEIVTSTEIGDGWSLRLQASWPKGVCSPQHAMQFDAGVPSPGDHGFASGGIRVVVLERQLDMLRGTEIDFGEKDGKQGFIIKTPNLEGEPLKTWGPILETDPLSAVE